MDALKVEQVQHSEKCEVQVEDQPEGRDSSVFRQHLAALLANLAAVSAGVCLGWTSPVLPLLQRQETDVKLPLYVTQEEGSWISCLLPLGAAVGSLPAGLLADYIGRKKAILSLAIPFIVGWLFILFADTSVLLVYIGRFIGGLGIGGTTVLVSQYNEEISEDSIRGALGVYLDFNLCNGILLVNVFGCFLSYIGITIGCSILPIIFVCTFVWMPESPVYLILRGKMDDATKSLLWLRKGKSLQNIHTEIEGIKERLLKQKEESDPRPITTRLKSFFSDVSSHSSLLKTLGIVWGLQFFQQAGGNNALLFYGVSIFQSSGSQLSSNVSSTICGAFLATSDFCSSLYVDRLGRRPMLMISALVIAVCLATLSVYCHFYDQGYDVNSWNWVPLASIVVYALGFTAGFSPLPWLLMAELVLTRHQSWVNPIASSLNWSFVFVITKEFPDMQIHLGNAISFGIFCLMAVASFIFVFRYVPETKGKSHEEIQSALRGKSFEKY